MQNIQSSNNNPHELTNNIKNTEKPTWTAVIGDYSCFFSYNESIDIYHCILHLQNAYTSTAPAYLSVYFEGTQLVLKSRAELFSVLEKCQEGMEMAGKPQQESMYALFLLQMGLFKILADAELLGRISFIFRVEQVRGCTWGQVVEG